MCGCATEETVEMEVVEDMLDLGTVAEEDIFFRRQGQSMDPLHVSLEQVETELSESLRTKLMVELEVPLH